MAEISVTQMASARIPTEVGEFYLSLFHNSVDNKEHLAIVYGDVNTAVSQLVRVHSECFTGDVLGSRRCDCGQQLAEAMRLIAQEGQGIILYMRQEGRGIGLLEKLKAYNLQDEGYDTVEANLLLGHGEDERDYTIAARILKQLGVSSIRLLTNNPSKVDSLTELGINVTERVPLHPTLNADNEGYLATKVNRMRHLLDLGNLVREPAPANGRLPDALQPRLTNGRSAVTLSYAQSVDGSITAERGQPMAISGPESLRMTHELRAAHDGILVGLGTVLADDPRLSVRLVEGASPKPIVLDSQLRFPLTARLLQRGGRCPLIVTTKTADSARQTALEAAGATVLRIPANSAGRIDLAHLLAILPTVGIESVMVEGGAAVITSFLRAKLVDRLVVTIAPKLVGGLPAVGQFANGTLPKLTNQKVIQLGEDMVLSGDVLWS